MTPRSKKHGSDNGPGRHPDTNDQHSQQSGSINSSKGVTSAQNATGEAALRGHPPETTSTPSSPPMTTTATNVDASSQRPIPEDRFSATPPPDIVQVQPSHPDAPQAGGFGSWPTQNETPGGAIGQSSTASCSSACGEMLSGGRLTQVELIEQIGAPSDAAALARGLGEGWQGGYVGPEHFDALLDRAPFAVEMYDGGSMGHTVVVDGLDSTGNVRIRDPWDGGSTYTMDPADFHQYWNGNAVFK